MLKVVPISDSFPAEAVTAQIEHVFRPTLSVVMILTIIGQTEGQSVHELSSDFESQFVGRKVTLKLLDHRFSPRICKGNDLGNWTMHNEAQLHQFLKGD